MKKYKYKLNCTFNVNPETFVELSNKLEIALPCVNCQRMIRTIVFNGTNQKGICTPKENCTGFLGELLIHEVIIHPNYIEGNYIINLDYEPFIDKKYKFISTLDTGWARVSFTLNCSRCKNNNIIITQGNLSRPFKIKCGCSNVIYQEEQEPFKYIFNEINS
ncbi:MAG: hypothetical protein U0457_13440 [Candidatus Sericytochromatia bacterium]